MSADHHITLSRRQVHAAGAACVAAVVAYLGGWMYLDGNFDYNREEFIREAETTREQIVNQGEWTRNELLVILQACTQSGN